MKIFKPLTAIAMATFVSASAATVIPTNTYAAEPERLTSFEANISAPIIGTSVTESTCTETFNGTDISYTCPSLYPAVTVPAGAPYAIEYSYYTTDSDASQPFFGTFAADTDYYAYFEVVANDGYVFDIVMDENTWTIEENNVAPIIFGAEAFDVIGADEGYIEIVATVRAFAGRGATGDADANATDTTEETTATTASATTKKSNNPKTGLDLASSFVLLALSLSAFAGLGAYARRKATVSAEK